MGVVHKLRDDVVDFILAQKKARPDISVRKLSDVVFKEFQVVVSKSSVSSVLKNANLNSPIGRHGSSVDEENRAPQKTAGTFKIPEQKKKQIFPVPKISAPVNVPKPLHPPAKAIKEEVKIEVKPQAQHIKPVAFPKMLPVKTEEKKVPVKMSNLPVEKKSQTETAKTSLENTAVKHPWGGMIFLKAAEWDLAGGSVLAKIIKDELGGRYDIDSEFLADILLFPELFDQTTSANANYRRIEKLFSAGAPTAAPQPQVFSASMAAVNQIENCGLKIAIEMEILLRGVSAVKISDLGGQSVFCNLKSKSITLDNVHSEDSISVAEAVKVFNNDVVKNVHSAVFHCFTKNSEIDQLAQRLLSGFGGGAGQGLKEAAFCDAEGAELVKYTYFPRKNRTFVLAVWPWKERWPDILNLAANGDFKALPVFGKTFYYHDIEGVDLADKAVEGLRAIIVSTTPSAASGHSEEPMVVLLTNSDERGDALKRVVLDYLYSWPGLTGESSPYLAAEAEGKKAHFHNVFNGLEPESSLTQCLSALRTFFYSRSQQSFFGVKANLLDEKAMKELFYHLPGHLRYENERLSAVTLDVPSDHPALDELKNAIRRFNSRMFRDAGGRRICLALSTPYSQAI